MLNWNVIDIILPTSYDTLSSFLLLLLFYIIIVIIIIILVG